VFFARLENACATVVERAFALAFPSALEPVQVARKLVAAFESGTPAGRAGRRFQIRMSASDFARLAPDLPYLERQWTVMLARLTERSNVPQRPPEVTAAPSDGVAPGTVSIAIEILPEPHALALRVRRGLPRDARVALADTTLVIGRDPACTLALIDPRVSRRHLEIVRAGTLLRFRDLGSSNGTQLNGLPATSGELGLGDVLQIGDSVLVVEPAESSGT
jgi:hypothetical protein